MSALALANRPADEAAVATDHPPTLTLRDPSTATVAELPGLPGYTILRELGRGGDGVVFEARQVGLNRTVALKMVLAGEFAAAADLGRFRAEAEAVARLQHPHIVQVYDISEHHGVPYFSLEYCVGGSLADRPAGSCLHPADAAQLVEALARGVQFAHEHGIVHRDLKPANVLLTPKTKLPKAQVQRLRSASDAGLWDLDLSLWTPKLTDFGIARRMDRGHGPTVTGTVLGTPSYISPEQANGQKDVGPASDVYALGALLYELLTGRPPFRGATALNTVLQVALDEPVAPRRLRPRVPRDLETVCLKCLQKEPRKRYLDARALADDLGRFVRGEPVVARRVSPVLRAARWVGRRPAATALVATWVLMAAAVAVGASLLGDLQAEREAAQRARTEALVQQHFAAEARAIAEQRAGAAAQAREAAGDEGRRAEAAQSEVQRERAAAAAAQAEVEHQRTAREAALKLAEEQSQRAQSATDQAEREATSADAARRQQAQEAARAEAADRKAAQAARRVEMAHYASQLTAAQRALDEGDAAGAEEVLAACRSDLRNWEHAYLLDLARRPPGGASASAASRPIPSLAGHGNRISGLAFSSAGRLVSASYDTTIKLWDEAGQMVRTLRGHPTWVAAVAVSPNGRLVASAGGEYVRLGFPVAGNVKIWNADDGKELQTLRGHRGSVRGVAFSPDGKRLATAGDDQVVRIWDLDTGQPIRTFRGGSAVAFSGDGRLLASASGTGVFAWEVDTGREVLRASEPAAEASGLAFSPDGVHLAAGRGRFVKIWHLDSGLAEQALEGRAGPVTALAYSPDGQRLVCGDAGLRAGHPIPGDLTIWDANTGQELLSLRAHAAGIRALAFRPDGRRIASAGDDKLIRLW